MVKPLDVNGPTDVCKRHSRTITENRSVMTFLSVHIKQNNVLTKYIFNI